MANYEPDTILNWDESGCMYNAQHGQTLIEKGADPKFKPYNEKLRVTFW